MEQPPVSSRAVILKPFPLLPARRGSSALALRLVALLPALVSTPRRALFTGGVALGLAAPPLARFLAARALDGAARSLGLPSHKPRSSVEEMVIERYSATRVTVRRRVLWGE